MLLCQMKCNIADAERYSKARKNNVFYIQNSPNICNPIVFWNPQIAIDPLTHGVIFARWVILNAFCQLLVFFRNYLSKHILQEYHHSHCVKQF